MGVHDYYDLRSHVGHEIVVASYGLGIDGEPDNVAIECETCMCVLVDYDHPDGVTPKAGGLAPGWRQRMRHPKPL